MKRSILALLVCLAGAAPPLSGAVSGQVDWVSRYIWRGFDLLPDNHAAIQPSFSADLGKSGIALQVWSSFALEQRREFRTSDEIDVTLAYAFKMPADWEMTAGLIQYGYWFADDFSFKNNTSLEVFATLSKPALPLAPELSIYYDIRLGSGLYATLGGSHEWEVNDALRLEVGGLVGFNSRQYIEKTGFADIDLFTRASWSLGALTLAPSLNLMIPLLDEVNDGVELWLGFTAAF